MLSIKTFKTQRTHAGIHIHSYIAACKVEEEEAEATAAAQVKKHKNQMKKLSKPCAHCSAVIGSSCQWPAITTIGE